jgi:hypothetical protein
LSEEKERLECDNANAVKLNIEFVSDLGKLMDDLLNKIPAEERPRLTYTIKYDKRERETSSTEIFRDLMKRKGVVGFNIWFRSIARSIRVYVEDYRIGCEISTENSSDDNWAIGVRERLSDIFNQHKSIRSTLSNNKSILFKLLLSFCMSLFMTFIINEIFTLDRGSLYIILGFGTYGVYWIFNPLINWLFPKIETEYMNRVKYRKLIIVGIVSELILPIPSAVITSFLLR